MAENYGFKIMISGDYACFTRPELKVERVSYDVPTPGALEGLIKCVYWKPAIRYVIDKIVVFNPIDFVNIRRNEVKDKVNFSAVKSAMRGKGGEPEIYTKESINQRGGMVLRNVLYGVQFHFELTGLRSDREDDGEAKHLNILRRRLQNGQCFRQPVLGCREFSVREIRLVDEFPLGDVDKSLMGDRDLGFMLYRMEFEDGGRPLNGDWNEPRFSDNAKPGFYRPHMVNGVIDVTKYRGDIRC